MKSYNLNEDHPSYEYYLSGTVNWLPGPNVGLSSTASETSMNVPNKSTCGHAEIMTIINRLNKDHRLNTN